MNEHYEPNVALDQIDSETPAEIRRRVVDIVQKTINSDAALFCRYSLNEEGDYFTSFEAVGNDKLTEAIGRHLEQKGNATCWDPRYPPKDSDQRFSVTSSGAETDCDIYREIEDHDKATALLYDGPYFLGWLAVLRNGDVGFSEEELERLNGLVGPATRVLATAEEREVELYDSKPARILINPQTHDVECATGNAYEWLNERRKERLISEIDKLDMAGSFPNKLTVDGFVVRVTRMSGNLGERLLATVEYAPAPEKRPDAALTPRQREVAGYAAAGATNREIAETLGITPDTVGDHLSEAYNRLGVANRVELALLLTQ